MKTIFLLIVAVICYNSAVCQDKSIEEKAKAMIAVINRGDRAGYKKFISENYTKELIEKKMGVKTAGQDEDAGSEPKNEDGLESKVNMYERLHQDMGEGKVSSLKHDGDKLLVNVAGSSGGNFTFTLTFTKDAPRLISGFGVDVTMGR